MNNNRVSRYAIHCNDEATMVYEPWVGEKDSWVRYEDVVILNDNYEIVLDTLKAVSRLLKSQHYGYASMIIKESLESVEGEQE